MKRDTATPLTLAGSVKLDTCGSGYAGNTHTVMQVELSERAQRVLRKLQPAADLAGAIEAVALDALRMRLRQMAEQLSAFEAVVRGDRVFAGTGGKCENVRY